MKKQDDGKRYEISVHLLDEEKRILEQKASEVNMSKSEFVRNGILHGAAYPETNFSREGKRNIQHELDRMANNLNAIRFEANTSKLSWEMRHELDCLVEDYFDLLSKISTLAHGSPTDEK